MGDAGRRVMGAACELCTGVRVCALRQLYVLSLCKASGHAEARKGLGAHPADGPNRAPCMQPWSIRRHATDFWLCFVAKHASRCQEPLAVQEGREMT